MFTESERRVLDQIDADRVVEWTRELVRIPSVYRPQTGEAEENAARWVQARFEDLGLETHWEEVAPGRPNVIGLLNGPAGGRCLMLEGHTDVVTEGDLHAWQHPPFAAEVADGKIYGRGGNDMKGGLVAAICATKALVDSGVKLAGTLLVGALVDEEGLMLGVKDFVRRGWAERVNAAIICEPEDMRICAAQKGVMWARVTVNGKMAHGAMPLTGVNPMYAAAKALVELQKLEAQEIVRLGSYEFLGQPSVTPTILQCPVRGEPQNNVMPGQCAFTLDIRLIPGQSPEEIQDKLRSVFSAIEAENAGISIQLDVIEARPPTETPRTEPVVQVIDAGLRDLTGSPPVYGGVPGTTDGTILYGWAGVPIVTCGPGNWLIPHHVDEYLEIDQLVLATKLYALAALRYLGVASS
ncbi:MAG: M20 family metallopeptidase [Chloroflexota bacterium]